MNKNVIPYASSYRIYEYIIFFYQKYNDKHLALKKVNVFDRKKRAKKQSIFRINAFLIIAKMTDQIINIRLLVSSAKMIDSLFRLQKSESCAFMNKTYFSALHFHIFIVKYD